MLGATNTRGKTKSGGFRCYRCKRVKDPVFKFLCFGPYLRKLLGSNRKVNSAFILSPNQRDFISSLYIHCMVMIQTAALAIHVLLYWSVLWSHMTDVFWGQCIIACILPKPYNYSFFCLSYQVYELIKWYARVLLCFHSKSYDLW